MYVQNMTCNFSHFNPLLIIGWSRNFAHLNKSDVITVRWYVQAMIGLGVPWEGLKYIFRAQNLFSNFIGIPTIGSSSNFSYMHNSDENINTMVRSSIDIEDRAESGTPLIIQFFQLLFSSYRRRERLEELAARP